MGDDINELQKEWRAIVISELNSVKISIENLRNDVVSVKTTVAQAAEVQSLRAEVDKLKDFKSKLLGMTIALNSLVVVIAWFLSYGKS